MATRFRAAWYVVCTLQWFSTWWASRWQLDLHHAVDSHKMKNRYKRFHQHMQRLQRLHLVQKTCQLQSSASIAHHVSGTWMDQQTFSITDITEMCNWFCVTTQSIQHKQMCLQRDSSLIFGSMIDFLSSEKVCLTRNTKSTIQSAIHWECHTQSVPYVWHYSSSCMALVWHSAIVYGTLSVWHSVWQC